jgi:uncharacterized protein (TIGR02145 family)
MKKSILLCAVLGLLFMNNQAQMVLDYDGNLYDTVMIGTQVWMKQNLKVTHYNNGSLIPNVADSTTWVNLTTGARCYYNNDSVAHDSVYGSLYNGYAVNDTSGICPEGWHVSTNAEWQTAEAHLGGVDIAGGKMKEAGTVHWVSPNTGASNSSRFTGLPGGMRDPANKFITLGENGLWWTGSAFNTSFVWSTYLWTLFTGVDHNPAPKNYGLSIRCVKDMSSGLTDLIKNEKIKIFPNPANSKFSIECNENQEYTIQVFNMAGECAMQVTIHSIRKEIDISSLSKGVYVVHISGADWSVIKKLIKE